MVQPEAAISETSTAMRSFRRNLSSAFLTHNVQRGFCGELVVHRMGDPSVNLSFIASVKLRVLWEISQHL